MVSVWYLLEPCISSCLLCQSRLTDSQTPLPPHPPCPLVYPPPDENEMPALMKKKGPPRGLPCHGRPRVGVGQPVRVREQVGPRPYREFSTLEGCGGAGTSWCRCRVVWHDRSREEIRCDNGGNLLSLEGGEGAGMYA